MSDVINSKIQIWRAKCLDGTITTEEMKEAIQAIRKERTGASVASTASKERKAAGASSTGKKPKPDGDALLAELGI